MVNDPMFAAGAIAILIVPVLIFLAILGAVIFGGGFLIGWFA